MSDATDTPKQPKDPHIGTFSAEEISQIIKEHIKPKRKSLFE